MRIYALVRPGEPPTLEKAESLLEKFFFNNKRYDLGEVGRFVVAIPSDVFADHRAELLANGRRVSRPPRAWIGFFCQGQRDHVVVAGVLPASPAARGGLEAGDVVVAVDGERVPDQGSLYAALWAQPPGTERALRVVRGDETVDLRVPTTEAEAFFA